MNTLVFDIETVPDVEFGRRLFDLEGLSDEEVGKAMQRCAPGVRQRFPAARAASHRRHLLRVPLARGLARLEPGDESATERELVERFFDGIEKFSPDLVCWNGGGFDLPVLHYRALRSRCRRRATGKPATKTTPSATTTISAAFTGGTSTSWTCCPDTRPRARASLVGHRGAARVSRASSASTARRSGMPICAGELTRIRRYCETDVLNTYLVFLRFQLMRGRLTDDRPRRGAGAHARLAAPRPSNRISTSSCAPGTVEP